MICQQLRTITMDRIDLFRVFIRVVECASFTRASETLSMPRSSVSAAVQELEARLGTRLLHRTTRTVSPTLDGEAFFERCQQLVADVEEAEDLFRQNPTRQRGRLRVDVPGRIGRLIIAPVLPEFLGRYPEIDISLGVTDRAVNMIEESVDCVLRVGHLSDSGMIARPVGSLVLINVASPAYLRQHGTPQTPTDLLNHVEIHYASPATGRIEPWEWVENGELHTLQLHGRVTVNSAEAYIACCLAGLGLIQIPAYDVKHHIEAGELSEVLCDYRASPMPMTLLYPHRRHLSRRVQLFADWLQDLLRRRIGQQV
jgi:LysR family transcriptional regulator for bpeEF and oprC